MTPEEALAALRAGKTLDGETAEAEGHISGDPGEIRPPEPEESGTEIAPEPIDAAMGATMRPCSPCKGTGGFAGGLECRTCNGKGQHSLTLPAKWIYVTRRRDN
jgi:RecJ-like exonuclease